MKQIDPSEKNSL